MLRSDEDYMLALALQQEDAAALVHNPSAQSVRMGDEAVAMALLGEEQAMLEQQTGGGVDDATFAGVPIREDRDRYATRFFFLVTQESSRRNYLFRRFLDFEHRGDSSTSSPCNYNRFSRMNTVLIHFWPSPFIVLFPEEVRGAMQWCLPRKE